jgi:hypothetical protein
MSWLKMPCLTALRATMALPLGVFGPVDFWAFSRFAANCFYEIMSFSFGAMPRWGTKEGNRR